MSDNIFNKLIKKKGNHSRRSNIIQKIFISFIALGGSIGFSLSPIAYAVSAFDGAITTTASVSIKNSTDSPLDITADMLAIMDTSCHSDYLAYMNTVGDEDGHWFISERYDGPGNTQDALIAWSTNPEAELHWINDGDISVTADVDDGVLVYMPESSSTPSCFPLSPSGASTIYNSSYFVTQKIFVSTFPQNYPSGYAGASIPGDSDGDLLSTLQETAQGTSDNNKDTDGDGISDYTESSWNPFYNETFCKQTSPYTCADPHPTTKDLYIEVDWMNDGVNDPYKPTVTQLEDIEDMLDNNGINVYFDLGEYGGGNQLPVYSSYINWYETTGQLDIHDFKYGGNVVETGLLSTLSPQFDHAHREGVWRYMIYGVEEITDAEIEFSSNAIGGGSEPAGDDVIIASENDDAFVSAIYSEDRAKEGVLAHEIGHLLCLTSSLEFPEMDEACEYEGVDLYAPSSNYKSVMNTAYGLPDVAQLATIDFSDGTNGIGDHDDWGAILGDGMGAFMYSGAYDDPSSFMAQSAKSNDHKMKKSRGESNERARDVTTFITGKAQDQARNESKVHQLSPWFRDR